MKKSVSGEKFWSDIRYLKTLRYLSDADTDTDNRTIPGNDVIVEQKVKHKVHKVIVVLFGKK